VTRPGSRGAPDATQRAHEIRKAARALLRTPLLRSRGAGGDDFRLVRQYTAELRTWFERNTGWPLLVDTEAARLRKLPGTTDDATHPAREMTGSRAPFTRRRYVLLCLALAVLERSEPQIALGRLADQIVLEAADPQLTSTGVEFTLESRDQRLDLVAVVRLLSHHGVLVKVNGDEDAYLKGAGDALYDVERRVLAGLLAPRRGPSTIDAPTFQERLTELAAEPIPDSEELRNKAVRHTLTRRLLDDPVLYYDELTAHELEYLTRQRGALTRRITDLTGLVAEVRAEGIAMVDPDDDLTDVRMPETGTPGHVTLLIAEHLASTGASTVHDLEAYVRTLAPTYGSFWAKTAKAPGAESELVAGALHRLQALGLIERGHQVSARPALARYEVGDPVITEPGHRTQNTRNKRNQR
jgi:uncharacterized protein (TIGR02678 family)